MVTGRGVLNSHMVTDPSSKPVRSGREEREEGKRREWIGGGEGGEKRMGGRREVRRKGWQRRGRRGRR